MSTNDLLQHYLFHDTLETYDPYDIWKTDVGVKIKKLYYKNKYLGLLPAGGVTLYDLYINNNSRYNYYKQEYPITRAQAAITLLKRYQQNNEPKYLEYGEKHINWLIENHSHGFSGYCWGMNYEWVYSAEEKYQKDTPFSTHTPYPLEALILYYEITQKDEIKEIIKSVFLFLEQDIQVMQESSEKLILSYGTQKDRIVTNANSYSMYMYALLLDFFPDKRDYIISKIERLYNFITSVQREDGSWLYSPYDEDTFIDCFHSAIVLKNLIKTDKIVPLKKSDKVIKDGYHYILENFINPEYHLFKRFSISNKLSLTKFDLYDNAEVLNLALLYNDNDTSEKLNTAIKKHFFNSQGEIASMIDLFGLKRNFNHLRWAVVPYLNTIATIKEL